MRCGWHRCGETAWGLLLTVDGSREQTDVVEEVGVVDADEEAVEATHRQACDGTMSLVLLHTVGLLNELHHIGEGCLETALHGLGQHHGGDPESLGSLTRTSLLRDVAIGHHHQHGLGLALSNQVVEYLGSTSQFAPGILITTDAMQQIEHRILLAAGLIACRGVDSEPAGKPCCGTLVPNLADSAVSHLVYLIEV